MMDGRALFPRGWHPLAPYLYPNGKWMPFPLMKPSRTAVGGVRYYFIDFGISSRNRDKVVGVFGVFKAPELSLDVPYDPYKVDIYLLGVTYKTLLIDVRRPACLLVLARAFFFC